MKRARLLTVFALLAVLSESLIIPIGGFLVSLFD